MSIYLRDGNGHSWTYGRRALAYMQMGQREQAIRDFERALSINPTLDWAIQGLQEILEN